MYQNLTPTLEINLDAIRDNYRLVKSRLSPSVACAAVVKADSYGLGMERIAPILHREGCREFYVAYAEEGLRLRQVLPEAVIYALHGVYGTHAKEMTAAGIIPVLNSQEDRLFWQAEARAQGKVLPAVLHVDTGMNRLGLPVRDFTVETEGLDIRYVMSHLACSEESAHPKNAEQLSRFTQITRNSSVKRSFANSGGVFLGQAYHFDQVRPGAAIYGITPVAGQPNPMRGVVALKVPVLQVREAAPGETVGYGAKYLVQKPTKLATISVGYADGFLRCLTEGGRVWIEGQQCAVVGRVSMDTVVVDATCLPVAPKAGDWAEIVGEHQTVDDVAAQARTIGYEVLTSLGKRYKRMYTGS